jgi:DNA-binding transcriptional MerR regulator
MPAKQDIRERFYSKIATSAYDDCWHWLDFLNADGYGHITEGNKRILAHRFSYALYKGNVPTISLVRHTCDTPACVNPDHLILGSGVDNAQDRERRGRNGVHKGANSHLSKLNEQQVLIIRWLKSQGLSLDKIAALYHVSKSCVWGIVNWRAWKHLPNEQIRTKTNDQEWEVEIKIVELTEKTYTVVVAADTSYEARHKALDMNITTIKNTGLHLKGGDTRETHTVVIGIVDPNTLYSN